MDLEGVPLGRTLQLMLAQLGLAYCVEDGMLDITSEGIGSQVLPPSMRRAQSMLTEKSEKAEWGELTLAEMKNCSRN